VIFQLTLASSGVYGTTTMWTCRWCATAATTSSSANSRAATRSTHLAILCLHGVGEKIQRNEPEYPEVRKLGAGIAGILGILGIQGILSDDLRYASGVGEDRAGVSAANAGIQRCTAREVCMILLWPLQKYSRSCCARVPTASSAERLCLMKDTESRASRRNLSKPLISGSVSSNALTW
jgi:hypothetical protein